MKDGIAKILEKVSLKGTAIEITMGAVGIALLTPFLYMLSTSFSRGANLGLPYPPQLIPEDSSLFNYVAMFKSLPLGLYYFNSTVVAVSNVSLMLLVSCLAGYAFAKGSFPMKRLLFLLVLATMMIPPTVTLVPMYLLTLKMGLYNTRLALILPTIASGYAIFLMTQYTKSIPNELLDAARMDGCTEIRIVWQIVLPLSKPVLAALGTLFFLWNWNSFLWPLVVLSDMQKYTLPIGIAFFQQQNVMYYGLMMAAATAAIIPVVVVFGVLQRYIVRGITLTGLKL